MLEIIYGTFTFGLAILSIAILVALLLFNFILMPLIKLLLTPIFNAGFLIHNSINKFFPEKKREENNDKQSEENIVIQKIKNNYIKIIIIGIFLPFTLFVIYANSLLLYNKIFFLNLNILLDAFFGTVGLFIYGAAITYLLKYIVDEDYKLYSPLVFIAMAIIIIKDKFF